MTSITPLSYAWARHPEATDARLDQLTEKAHYGYEAALALAEDAYERSRDIRRAGELEPLTVEELAQADGLAPAQLARWIALARRQLFGDLSDAAIYKRLQRQRRRRPRRCADPGCRQTIPVTAPANKKYCHHHATGAERVRRHRTRKP